MIALAQQAAVNCCQELPHGGSINTPQLRGVTNSSEYIPLPGQMRTCTPASQFSRPVQINIAQVVTGSLKRAPNFTPLVTSQDG